MVDLRSCPFCGGNEIIIRPVYYAGDRQSTLLRTVPKMFRTDCAKVDNEAGRSQRLE